MTLYPEGYKTRRVSMAMLRALHEPHMHPEFARRLFPWIESKGGSVGIGGGWRETQPAQPGFAPEGKSFHQDQRFASGFVGFSAVDLVAAGKNNGDNHVTIAWATSADAPKYGLHTFISGEPWHMQCIEMRGWQSWVNAGRPDPKFFQLPGVPPPTPIEGVSDVFYPIQPTRTSDTRIWPGVPLPANTTATFSIPESVVPKGATAVALNVAAVPAGGAGFVTVWPDGAMPNTSVINFSQSATNGAVIVGVKNGTFKIQSSLSAAHLICDITGYWIA